MAAALLDHAETGSLRSRLNVLVNQGKDVAAQVAVILIEGALAGRDRLAASQALTFIPPEGTVNPADDALWPREWYVALVARSFGDNKRALSAFAAARTIAAKTAQEQPDYAPAWKMLGAIDAGLGDKADAVTEGNMPANYFHFQKTPGRGPPTLPISRESITG